jgi:ABC-type uncharacterized transport system substrate-binding protein
MKMGRQTTSGSGLSVYSRGCGRGAFMFRGIRRILLAVAMPVVPLSGQQALAHPHVWATIKVELVYATDGALSRVRHIWTFDEIFSAFAVSGIERANNSLSREQLAPIADRYVGSLKAYDYFTHAMVNEQQVLFDNPKDYEATYNKGVFTLQFSLPVRSTKKSTTLQLELYDPTYFVELAFAENDPVTLVGAPSSCQFTLSSPSRPQIVDESFFKTLRPDTNWAAQFARKIVVRC